MKSVEAFNFREIVCTKLVRLKKNNTLIEDKMRKNPSF